MHSKGPRCAFRPRGGFETSFAAERLGIQGSELPAVSALHKLHEIRAALVQESALECVICFRDEKSQALNPETLKPNSLKS